MGPKVRNASSAGDPNMTGANFAKECGAKPTTGNPYLTVFDTVKLGVVAEFGSD